MNVYLCRSCADQVPTWIDVTLHVYEPERCDRCGALAWTIVNVDAQVAKDAGIVTTPPGDDPDDPLVIEAAMCAAVWS